MEGFVIFKDLHKRIYLSEPKKVFISILLGAEIYHLIHVGHFYFLMALTYWLAVRGEETIILNRNRFYIFICVLNA